MTEQHRCEAVRRAFNGWLCARRELEASTHWQDIEALIDAAVVEQGRLADMLVLEQARGDGDIPQRVTIRRALLETGRPIVVMPHRPCTVFGRRVAIFLRDDAAAAKALLAAIPWLAHAETVDVIVGVRHGGPIAALPPILADQAIAARLHRIPVPTDSLASELLAKAKELHSDMIVMGAYGQGPLRRLFLGSVTDSVLAKADRPVLLCR